MADPAMHSARAEAERLGEIVDVPSWLDLRDADRMEDYLDFGEEAELFGAWVRGEGRPA